MRDIKIAYIGGGSRGWAWGLMSDLAKANDICGEVALYDIDLKGKYTEIDVATCRFYYENKNQDKGIVAIATDTNVLGFEMGITTKQEVEEAVGKKGEVFAATKEEETFLAFPLENLTIFRVEYTKAVLDFYFYENTLVNAVLKSAE